MSTYLYELPTTGAISFTDFCIDPTPESVYAHPIADATQARANVRDALKESKRAENAERDWLKIVKVLDEYIPHLLGIISCITTNEISLRTQPIFSWRTTLSSTLFNTSPRVPLPGLHAELASTLLTSAFALSNLARAAVAALGPYEHARSTSDAERRTKDERIGVAATMLCRAAGILEHVSGNVLATWERERAVAGTVEGFVRPPELTREVLSALSKMALADAQTLAIRKLLTKSAYDSIVTPGPPLPKSHPAPALIAKLHLECATLYTSARTLCAPASTARLAKLKSASHGSGAGASAGDDVTPELRRYLADEAALHTALAHKWLGVDASEHGRAGEAVGFLAWAREVLDGGGKGKGAVAIGEREKERRGRWREEADVVGVWLVHCRKMNEMLTFESIPSQPELQARIPAGRSAISVRAYTPPAPVFGPGSVEWVRRAAEALEVDDGNGEREGTTRREATGKYAGAGSYF